MDHIAKLKEKGYDLVDIIRSLKVFVELKDLVKGLLAHNFEPVAICAALRQCYVGGGAAYEATTVCGITIADFVKGQGHTPGTIRVLHEAGVAPELIARAYIDTGVSIERLIRENRSGGGIDRPKLIKALRFHDVALAEIVIACMNTMDGGQIKVLCHHVIEVLRDELGMLVSALLTQREVIESADKGRAPRHVSERDKTAERLIYDALISYGVDSDPPCVEEDRPTPLGIYEIITAFLEAKIPLKCIVETTHSEPLEKRIAALLEAKIPLKRMVKAIIAADNDLDAIGAAMKANGISSNDFIMALPKAPKKKPNDED